MIRDQCTACPEQGLVFVGGDWWCGKHLDDGFRHALLRSGTIVVEIVDTEGPP